jgi:fatty-acyl-CoA synthase
MLWVAGPEARGRGRRPPQPRQRRCAAPPRCGRCPFGPVEGLTNRDTALYIYTSGTTGMPKAARIPHSRARTYMRAFAGLHELDAPGRHLRRPAAVSFDRRSGRGRPGPAERRPAGLAQAVLGDQFLVRRAVQRARPCSSISASCAAIWSTARGEDERSHKLKLAFGNGLRPDVWPEFQKRFAIPDILEFYGSTEGNVSVFNFDGKPGAIGRVPRTC